MRAFLTAEWRYLLMLNYAVEPELLRPFVPNGVELDSWQGVTFVSMVGFLFQKTKVLGWGVPWHRDFEEVNLRFYVRRRGPEGWRRGVVFIREIVPRALIAVVARRGYNEPYLARPMRHSIDTQTGAVEYGWRHHGRWNTLRGVRAGEAGAIAAGSEEEFITEHYWGYTAQRDAGAKEYRVEHERWKIWPARAAVLDCDVTSLYGEKFAEPLGQPPLSAFVADGSPVTVGFGTRLKIEN